MGNIPLTGYYRPGGTQPGGFLGAPEGVQRNYHGVVLGGCQMVDDMYQCGEPTCEQCDYEF